MSALGDQRLLFVTGKGGVGKSTVSAALALGSAHRGKRTLVCEVNTEERISGLLGHPPVGPEIGQLEENLWAVDVRPQEALREYGLMILKLKSVYNAVFENRLVRYFLRFIPSLQELTLLGKILFHLDEKQANGQFRFDRVIIDGPATGHAISFLSLPQVILDTVPPGPLSEQTTHMRDLLLDPAVTAAVLVTLPEEMPLNETFELYAALQHRVRVHTRASVLNMAVPPRFTPGDLEALAPHPALLAAARAHREREGLTEGAWARIRRELPGQAVQVPRLFLPAFGRAAIDEVARALEPLWGPR